MADTQVLDMPVKFSLDLMTIICSNRVDTERKLGNDGIDEMNGIFLGVFGINL